MNGEKKNLAGGDAAFTVRNLSRSYGKVRAVQNLDVEVRSGTVHGFLGPNGAGKTTVIKILLGLILPNHGEVEVFGKNLFSRRNEVMMEVGAVVEAPVLFEYLTAYENLYYLCRLSAKPDSRLIRETLFTVGLENVADRKVSTFSYGMKQRLGIAQALLPQSRLIFLDEPTNGLDPHGIAGVRELVKKLCREKGITIFISSHLLTEIEQTCDYVTIIDKGVKICESPVGELLTRRRNIRLKTRDRAALLSFADEKGIKVVDEKQDSGMASFVLGGSEDDIPEIVAELSRREIGIYGITQHCDTLEEIFIELTGKSASDSVSDRF